MDLDAFTLGKDHEFLTGVKIRPSLAFAKIVT